MVNENLILILAVIIAACFVFSILVLIIGLATNKSNARTGNVTEHKKDLYFFSAILGIIAMISIGLLKNQAWVSNHTVYTAYYNQEIEELPGYKHWLIEKKELEKKIKNLRR